MLKGVSENHLARPWIELSSKIFLFKVTYFFGLKFNDVDGRVSALLILLILFL
jgi:hypothetical protein